MDFKVVSVKDKEVVKAYVDKLPEGKRFDVSVKLHREKRTVDQNRLLFFGLAVFLTKRDISRTRYTRYLKRNF